MSKKRTVSEIFKPYPQKWGLRGDVYFRHELEEYFSGYTLPYSPEQLRQKIFQLHLDFTHEPMTDKSIVFCSKYAHGGMSSGLICGEFWLNTAIPMLCDRLNKLNKK